MDEERIIRRYYILKNKYQKLRWTFQRNGYYKSVLLNNKMLKDSHCGERCFILGNGPSLKSYDLCCLKDEFVFAVNDFVRFPIVESVKPDAYVLADPKFFDLDVSKNEQDRIFCEKVKLLSTINNEVKMFLPIDNLKQFSTFGWENKDSIYYFAPYLYFYTNYDEVIDFSRQIPGVQNVVQYCIMLAIYMGFKEIYLLGTDQTNILGNLKAYISSDISEYAYELVGDEKKWKHKKLIEYPLVTTLKGYARIFELYDEINKYCIKRNIKLFNCAPETMIDSIPKFDFLSLFS